MALFGLSLSLLGGQAAGAQFRPETYLVDSFEGGVAGWAGESDNTLYLKHAQSTVRRHPRRQQHAARSLRNASAQHPTTLERRVGLGRVRTVNATDATRLYNAFNAVAANPSAWSLEFDVRPTARAGPTSRSPPGRQLRRKAVGRS